MEHALTAIKQKELIKIGKYWIKSKRLAGCESLFIE